MAINLVQPFKGYRYSIDAFLLASFCKVGFKKQVLDIGSGCGILTLLLAMKYRSSNFTGVDIQEELVRLSVKNCNILELSPAVKFLNIDICNINKFFNQGDFDIVVANPPYYKARSGRINSNDQEACARHEINCCLVDFIKASSFVLKEKGNLYLIFTKNRLVELIFHLYQFRLEPKIMRFIYPKEGFEAALVLIKSIKGGKTGLRVLPPLIISKNDGKYSSEVINIFRDFDFLGTDKIL